VTRASAEKFPGEQQKNSKKYLKIALLSLFQGGGRGGNEKKRKIAKNNEK